MADYLDTRDHLDDDYCRACGRESLTCSMAPCPAVVADRGEGPDPDLLGHVLADLYAVRDRKGDYLAILDDVIAQLEAATGA